MEFLADENVESEWVGALREDGHDVRRVVDVDDLGVSAPDEAVIVEAVRSERVILTADQSDFSDPPREEHHGILIITDGTLSGGDLRRAVRTLERAHPEPAGTVAYVSDWLE